MPSLLLSSLLLGLAGPSAGVGSPPAAGRLLGVGPCDAAPSFTFAAAAPRPQPLRVAGSQLCVGWTKSDCDGLCLVTERCTAATPTWTAQPGANATHLRSTSTGCAAGCCVDYEDKVAHLQAFPACTSPLGNQAFELVPQGGGAVKLRSRFAAAGCVSVLATTPPPGPAPIVERPINRTLDGYWRPSFHPTGFGALASKGVGHLQDPSAPFQDAAGVWHVFPDCTPPTWNAGVQGGLKTGFYLGWCHLTSPDLVRWTHHGPAVWFNDDAVARNGSGFGGNCGTVRAPPTACLRHHPCQRAKG